MGLLLGLESSSEFPTVLLCSDGEILAMVRGESPFSHAAVLTRLIQQCLEAGGRELPAVDGIFLSMGPGSYTSLRVGVSTAKGLAFALDVPLLALPTLRVLALSAQNYKQMNDASYAGIIDAGRGSVYLALYDASGEELLSPRYHSLSEDLPASFKNREVVFAGSGIARASQTLGNQCGLHWTSPAIAWSVFAQLGEEKFVEGAFADLVHGEPIYLNPPFITQAKPLF